MFKGTIPPDVQRIMGECVKTWKTDNIYVGCSGNLTVERTLASIYEYKLHGNDVSLYSCLLGRCYSGEPFRCELHSGRGFDWLAPYMSTPHDRVATMFLATRFVDAFHASGEVKDNVYYQRLIKATQDQFPALHEKTAQKIRTLSLKLQSFFVGDVFDYLDEIPQNIGFLSFPPFWAGGYTTMWKKLDILFDWDPPAFKEIDDDRKLELIDKITAKNYWLFMTSFPMDKFRENQVGLAQTTNRGVPVFLYASDGKKRLVTPNQSFEGVKNARLIPGMEIGERISLAMLNQKQFQALRSQYMNNIYIKPGMASEAYGVLVDGYLVGVFAISVSPTSGAFSDPNEVYMITDFPVAPTSYPKLAKLVLLAATSKEARMLCERVTRRRVKRVFTTAFSNHPESMKYRGVFTLYSRKENPDWSEGSHERRYVLNYTAPAGGHTLSEALALWKKKYAKQEVGSANQNNQY